MFLKKILIGSAIAVAAGGLVLGHRDAFSYLRTGATSLRSAVKAEVPVEFEIARARNLVEELVPDIRRCMHVIAEQQVDVEHLQQSIAQKDSAIGKQKDALMSLRTDLGTGKHVFVYASRSYTQDEVKRDLAVRFERFKAAEDILAADKKILAARQQHLVANQEKLTGMMQAKKDLEVKLEQLQARLETIRAAETVSTLAIDDSNLSHARRLIDDLNKQLDVKQKVMDSEGKFTGLIPVETAVDTTPNNITDQIDAYFSTAPADAATVAGN